MADTVRIETLIQDEGIGTTVDATFQDWWMVLADVLERLGIDAKTVAPFFETLRPVVLVVVPLLLLALLVRVAWTVRRRPVQSQVAVVIETPASPLAAPLHLAQLLEMDDRRAALGLLWSRLAQSASHRGMGQWHPDSTPGEFFRSLEPPVAAQEPWRAFTTVVERGVFGPTPPTPDVLRDWWAKTESWW